MTQDKCPKCGSGVRRRYASHALRFRCNSELYGQGTDCEDFVTSYECLDRQRDQLQAKLETLRVAADKLCNELCLACNGTHDKWPNNEVFMAFRELNPLTGKESK